MYAKWKHLVGVPGPWRARIRFMRRKLQAHWNEHGQRVPGDFDQWTDKKVYARFYDMMEPKVRAQYPEAFSDDLGLGF